MNSQNIVLASEKAEVGKPAPRFELKDHQGKTFKLTERENKGATVLFLYPKAFTPGCTDQVCSYRDFIKEIRDFGAEVYGMSGDTVEKQASFHQEYQLNFTLLADPKKEVIKKYAKTYPLIGISKRWTFILDRKLVVRAIFKDVDPTADAEQVIDFLKNNKDL